MGACYSLIVVFTYFCKDATSNYSGENLADATLLFATPVRLFLLAIRKILEAHVVVPLEAQKQTYQLWEAVVVVRSRLGGGKIFPKHMK